ncbi:hypothetical protein BOX15_Mlig010005g1 [Macrostomum lignano]|uniref:Arf-GAP with SH3 domain, ANK repeat and PH domain-containing protein 1 n=2 Tax=Macrostomum lignano TaxID=282301 RepID=A0A267F1B8_9PLAT|nr:hypothetical protein BOX15_Mlig010005g1 [Macrostomum lignano]
MLNEKFSEVVADVIGFVNEDLHGTNSNTSFTQRVSQLRKSVESSYADLEQDKTAVKHVRKAIKELLNSGRAHQQCEADLSSLLDNLSNNALKGGLGAVGAALSKFSVAFSEVNALLGNLMQSLSAVMYNPLDSFVNTELKVDLRKGVDKALKDYETRVEKSRKERLQSARDSRLEVLPVEASDGSDRERHLLQLQLCEFLITAADVKSKKQSGLVQYLSDYCACQLTYFKESLRVLQQLHCEMRGLAESLDAARCEHEGERRSLVKLRDELRNMLASERDNGSGSSVAYSLHQSQGNRAHGTAKQGYLLKRSGSKVKKVWQKRRAAVTNGCFLLYHADDSLAPVSLPLLTCQVRPASNDRRGHGRGSFSLVSNNRTYSFQCDSLSDAEHWVSVLSNAKADAFQAAMGGSGGGDVAAGCYSPGATVSPMPAVDSMRADLLQQVRSLPGNQICADCNTADPEWISTNLGILICLECCGIHRDLGVHVSRTQSLLMDDLTPAQLLTSRCVGNAVFNEVFEAVLPDGVKPGSSAGWTKADLQQQMNQRKSFIRSKYRERSFVCRTVAPDADPAERARSLARDLSSAVRHRRMPLLLQAFAEGCDLMTQQHQVASGTAEDDSSESMIDGETSLHALLRESPADLMDDEAEADADGDSLRRLAVLEFTLQNSPLSAQCRATRAGRETLVHYCVRYNQPDCLRICLRAPGLAAAAAASAVNSDGLTAIDLCARLGDRDSCAAIIRAVEGGNLAVLDNPGAFHCSRQLAGDGAGPPLSREASYPDLSLCSEDTSAILQSGGSVAVSRDDSLSRRSSGDSSGAAAAASAAAAAAAVASRQSLTPKKSRAPELPPAPPLPPTPPLRPPPPSVPAGQRRPSSSYDSVQIVIDAAAESFLASSDQPEPPQTPPLPPPPPIPPLPAPKTKPKPLPKPKPRLARASMPPMQLQSLAAAASVATDSALKSTGPIETAATDSAKQADP